MSDSSGTHLEDLSVSPLPLTQKLRDELDAIILGNVRFIATHILDCDSATADELSIVILQQTILQANDLLRRENLKDVRFDVINAQILDRHPKLREVIRAACQRREFASLADLSEPFC